MPRRKIPARRHHGVRDPLKQRAIRQAELSKITNNPPDGDGQEVSRKFAHFMKLANAAKSGRKFKRKRGGIEDKPKENKNGSTRSSKKIGTIKQFPNEDDDEYLSRVNRVTREALKEAEYEAKYGVSVLRNPKTGAITIKKKAPNEIDELLKRKKTKSKDKGEKSAPIVDPKVKKELIKQAIREDKEEAKKVQELEFKKDIVQFGEVVHAPPALTTLPRHATRCETVPRPGKKGLLLKTLISRPSKQAITQASKTEKTTSSISKRKLKTKRKDMPAAARAVIEKEQANIIDLYRQIKNKRNLLNS